MAERTPRSEAGAGGAVRGGSQERGEVLDQGRRPGVGQAEVPVPALPLLREEARLDEAVEVLARRRGRDPRDAGQFGGGPRAAVEERQAHRGPGGFGERRREPGQRGRRRIGSAGHVSRAGG